jgi:hypothetical protein
MLLQLKKCSSNLLEVLKVCLKGVLDRKGFDVQLVLILFIKYKKSSTN